MKHSIIILTGLLLAAILWVSCHKSDIKYESSFDKSYKEWLLFKQRTGNNYKYKVAAGTWVGFGWETMITVTNGKITRRAFKLTPPRDRPSNVPVNELEWTEEEGSINSHTASPAAAPITLDQVYEKARTDWLLKRKDVTTYFETNNNGMISSCGYVENNCADDCFIGITITLIETL